MLVRLESAKENYNVAGAWPEDGAVFVVPAHVVAIVPVWSKSDEWLYCRLILDNGGEIPIAESAGAIAEKLFPAEAGRFAIVETEGPEWRSARYRDGRF